MADDIVVDGFIYRRRGEQWLEIDCLYGRGELVDDDAAALLNEIERLRAKAARADELQALIDAWASADRKLFHFDLRVGIAEVYAEREKALAALLAAETKKEEDDRAE